MMAMHARTTVWWAAVSGSNNKALLVLYCIHPHSKISYKNGVNSVNTSQQTRDAEPMLIQCLPRVGDSGPTLNQHWFSISCFLGYVHVYEPISDKLSLLSALYNAVNYCSLLILYVLLLCHDSQTHFYSHAVSEKSPPVIEKSVYSLITRRRQLVWKPGRVMVIDVESLTSLGAHIMVQVPDKADKNCTVKLWFWRLMPAKTIQEPTVVQRLS